MSWKSLRVNIEAVTVAILLALLIRHRYGMQSACSVTEPTVQQQCV